MNKDTMDLTILPNDALERLADAFGRAGNIDDEELCLMEMLRRNHFPVVWLDELTEMAG